MPASFPIGFRKQSLSPVLAQLGVGACLGGALLSLGSPGSVQAQGVDSGKVDRLERENKDLRTRLEALESVAKKEGLLPSGSAPNSLKVLSETTLSGFVQASYFYNTSEPSDRESDGYLWNHQATPSVDYLLAHCPRIFFRS